MSGILSINRAMQGNKTAQDALGTILSRGGATVVSPLFDHADRRRRWSRFNLIGELRTMEDGVDAAVPVDAQNAPTRDLENCTTRSFPQRPHRSFFLTRPKRTTKNAASVPIRLSQQRGSPHTSPVEGDRTGSAARAAFSPARVDLEHGGGAARSESTTLAGRAVYERPADRGGAGRDGGHGARRGGAVAGSGRANQDLDLRPRFAWGEPERLNPAAFHELVEHASASISGSRRSRAFRTPTGVAWPRAGAFAVETTGCSAFRPTVGRSSSPERQSGPWVPTASSCTTGSNAARGRLISV
jgi:hypothetical protein